MVQLYTREGGEFTVNSYTPGRQSIAHVTGLLSGGFVIVWNDPSARYGIVYDASGAAVAGFTVASTPHGVAPLPTGGFVVTSGDGQIFAQRFDASGVEQGGTTEVTPPLPDHPGDAGAYGGSVAVLASGDFVVTWMKVVEGFDFVDIYARRIDSAGNPIGSEFLVNTYTGGLQRDPSITALASGGFIITWGDEDHPLWTVRAQIYDAEGIRVGDEFQISEGEGGKIVALPGGGFVVTWTEATSEDGAEARAQIFTDAGVKVGPEILVNTITEGGQSPTGIEALPWGGFIITWMDGSEQGGDEDGSGVLAQVFDSGGGKIGAPFLVNTSILGDQTFPVVAALSSGELVFAWTDDDRRSEDNFDSEIKAQIFRPLPDNGDDVITGDDGPNILDGGDGNDTITALGGNDILDGEGGSDIVRAGAGDDRLFVSGSGADVAEGGTGFDTLVVGYRDATLRISMTPPTADPNGGFNGTIGGGGRRTDYNGIEALVAATGSGDDLLIGLGGEDVLDGGIGNDIVRGGAGNDRLLVSGGGGADAVEGGAGSDTLVVDYRDSAIRISMTAPTVNPQGGNNGTIGGGGRRIDYNGVEAVVATTGSGDDLLNGLVGNDVLDGGAGNDVLNGGAGDDRLLVSGIAADSAAGGSGLDTLVVDYGDATARISMTLPTANPAGGSNGTIGGGGRRTDYNGIEAFIITTGSGSDSIVTGGGNDQIRPGSGADAVSAGGGDDILLFLASLNATDAVNGGGGVDTFVLQGNYAAGLTLANVRDMENMLLLSGKNREYGEPGTSRYDYTFTTVDFNFAAGAQAWINGIDLLAGEDLTFNGAVETDASFLVYGGRGVDILTGGLGDDTFFFANQRFDQGDKVDGRGGYDTLILRGLYGINFDSPANAGRLTGIEKIVLVSGSDARYAVGGGSEFHYEFVLADVDLAAGATLTIDGSSLIRHALGSNFIHEFVRVDGSLETDGKLELIGGASYDTLTGGAGADVIQGGPLGDELRGGGGADLFRYLSAADAPDGIYDHIRDFTPGTDKIDLAGVDADSLAAGDQAFRWIGSGAFSGTGAASAGELRLFVHSSGTRYIEGDTDGNGFGDFIIEVNLQGPTPLGAGDFIL